MKLRLTHRMTGEGVTTRLLHRAENTDLTNADFWEL